MRRIIVLAVLAAAFAYGMKAQPRAAGIRIGASGFEASYQHAFGKNFIESEVGMDFGFGKNFIESEVGMDFGFGKNFIEFEVGMDFGYGGVGFKATALYNFMIARPAWTDRGSWGIYAGPGLSTGYVSDRVTYRLHSAKNNRYRIHTNDYGYMFSFTGQVGLEYTFWFPLQLSIDIRPYFGFHANGNTYYGAGKVEFYNYGMMGFVPTVSARYRF